MHRPRPGKWQVTGNRGLGLVPANTAHGFIQIDRVAGGEGGLPGHDRMKVGTWAPMEYWTR
jgi:hypothetical protein